MPCSTKPSATLYLALILAVGWQALAVNDWSVPCTQGECSWDLPPDSGASGSIHIVRLCFASNYRFSEPSLTVLRTHIVGSFHRDFGHHHGRWLENYEL